MEFPEAVALCVTRIRVTFTNGAEEKSGDGTAFWVRTKEGVHGLVTNRHVVDPKLALGVPDQETWILDSLAVELRWATSGDFAGLTSGPVEFHQVQEFQNRLFLSENDCALLVEPFIEKPDSFAHEGPMHLDETQIAREDELEEWLCLLESVFFIGFPGTIWDQRRTLPIARMANVAFRGTFHHKDIKTGDVCLVTGLSFGGASGSPVVLPFNPAQYILPRTSPKQQKLVGIMSGHWDNSDLSSSGKPDHTGLSYFTRSTSILALIEESRNKGFKNTP